MKFIDIVTTQASTTSEPKLRAFVPPCETLLLLALCSKTSTTLFLTRRRGGTEAHPPNRTEPKIVGRFRFIRRHARHGIRLCDGTEPLVLCTHSPAIDEEPKKSPDAHGIGASPNNITPNMKIYRRRRTITWPRASRPPSNANEDGSGTVARENESNPISLLELLLLVFP